MKVEIVDRYEDFEAMRPAWNRVHAQDHESDYFTSWRWLNQVFLAYPGNWLVAAAKDDVIGDGAAPAGSDAGSYVCFLPLRVKRASGDTGARGELDLEAAGRLSWGQYTGLVCLPRYEAQAAAAVGAAVEQRLSWRRMSLENCASSPARLSAFLGPYADSDYDVRCASPPRPAPKVDNLVCPFVTLPDDFEAYLRTAVSANTRQKVRRFDRRIEQDPALRFSMSDASSMAGDLDQLLELWRRKWAPIRGEERARQVMTRYREILAHSAALDAIFLLALRRGDEMLGAVASIVDHDKRRMYFIVAGRDESAADPFIGLALHAQSIRWAIGHGMAAYDFCHGNEPYKYAFGCTDRRLVHLEVTRRA
jgi:CelD/BcsL family acetyltransferase involved in cellulose biosynthesis